MARREVVGRYRGSTFGLLWSLFNPLVLLATYTFLFGVVFRARWGVAGEGGLEYGLVLFIGLIVHGVFAECVTRAPTLLLQHVNLVKRVVFPLEVLPWTLMASALFHAAVSLAVWLLVAAAIGLWPGWTALLLPLVLAPLVPLTLGCTWFLASLGVFVRDVGQVVVLAVTIMLFVSPILYPATAVPEAYRSLLALNPLTPMVEGARGVLVAGTLPDFWRLGQSMLVNLGIAWFGFWWFQRTRKGFADVL
jgi:lipopolysaccharide transport system permease protein